jgi:predicted transposase/invertase (TIGR01784 family)
VVDTARDEGKAEGKAEGKIEEKFEIAQKLKQEGFSIEMIEKVTGLSVEKIGLLK